VTQSAAAAAALPWQLAGPLRAAEYTSEYVRQAFGISGADDIGLLNHAAAVERLAADRSPAAMLTRLFFLEVDETVRHVARVFSHQQILELTGAGVLQRLGVCVRSRVRIDAVGSQYFIADRRFRAFDAGALRLPGGDPVYPPSSDSLLLADAVSAPHASAVLDLCTGSGIQAVRCAAQADQVIAVDLNQRAATLAMLNARLNGIENVDVRLGTLYAPVRGLQFDLVLANPPFVASPYTRAPSYHAGGPTGDRVLRRIIAGWNPALRERGRAFAVSHVALRTGESLDTRAQGWFADFAGRAVVFQLETGTAVDLAAAQALFALQRGLAAYASEIRRWLGYLRRHRIATVALVVIAAERGKRGSVEVVDAQPRVLPIPLTLPVVDRVRSWFAT